MEQSVSESNRCGLCAKLSPVILIEIWELRIHKSPTRSCYFFAGQNALLPLIQWSLPEQRTPGKAACPLHESCPTPLISSSAPLTGDVRPVSPPPPIINYTNWKESRPSTEARRQPKSRMYEVKNAIPAVINPRRRPEVYYFEKVKVYSPGW